MPLESTLNALWVCLGAAAVCAAFWAACVRIEARRPKLFQVLCVVLVVAALFPYISATDDSLRLQYLQSQQQTNPTDSRSHDNLMRLYEAMDAPIAAQFFRIVLTLFTVAVVTSHAVITLERATPRIAGRSPPLPI